MATNGEKAYELHQKAIGETEGTGEWVEITQERINAFADVTEDHQFIHVDPEKAKKSYYMAEDRRRDGGIVRP